MTKLTDMQHIVLEEIAYGYVYKKYGHGYIKQAPEGGGWEKASITVKSLVKASPPLLAVLTGDEYRVYLTSKGWQAFTPDGIVLVGESAELTQKADWRVNYLERMTDDDDGDCAVAGEYSRRHVNVR